MQEYPIVCRVQGGHLGGVEDEGVDGGVLLVHGPPLVETHLAHYSHNQEQLVFQETGFHLVLWVEHPDLAPDAAAGQDVGLLVVEGEGGPGQRVEVLLDVLVLVLHQHRPRVDVDDADAVAAARRHVRRRLGVVLCIWLENNLGVIFSPKAEPKRQIEQQSRRNAPPRSASVCRRGRCSCCGSG